MYKKNPDFLYVVKMEKNILKKSRKTSKKIPNFFFQIFLDGRSYYAVVFRTTCEHFGSKESIRIKFKTKSNQSYFLIIKKKNISENFRPLI